MESMPKVKNCATTSCSFNQDGCNAFAMTMGQKGCVTFVEIGRRAGLDRSDAAVGACKRSDCAFNHDLECGADAVTVGADAAECLTFQPA